MGQITDAFHTFSNPQDMLAHINKELESDISDEHRQRLKGLRYWVLKRLEPNKSHPWPYDRPNRLDTEREF